MLTEKNAYRQINSDSSIVISNNGTAVADESIVADMVNSTIIIQPHHREEFHASGINNEIIDLNARSLNTTELEQRLEPNLKTPNARNYIYRETLKNGAWLFGNTLKADIAPKGRNSRYICIAGKPVEPDKLEMPESFWKAVAEKYGVSAKSLDQDGWEWVKSEPKIDVMVAEGVKEAASVMSHFTIPCLAIQGHTQSYIANGNLTYCNFLQKDRNIYLAFDNDEKFSARSAVDTTIKGNISRLENTPESIRPNLYICHWYGAKGIGDYLVLNPGEQIISELLSKAIPSYKWVPTADHCLGRQPDITYNSRYLPFTEIHPETTLIGIKGAKGCGKSVYLRKLAKKAIADKRPVLVLQHRVQLSIQNALELGLDYIGDLEETISESTNISMCINSLWKINPENFKGGLIIIDEIVATLNDSTISPTCRSRRLQIQKTFEQIAKVILESGGQFVVADADLDHKSLSFLQGLLGGITPYIIENTYKSKGFRCFVSSGYTSEEIKKPSPIDIIAACLAKALKGERVMIHVTAQREDKTFSAQNLERLFRDYGVTDVITIDSQTTQRHDHQAFRATSRINEICDAYQVVICTPSVSTGVSIENQNKFDLVAAIFSGVGNCDAVRQTLMRVRDIKVDRLIWIANEGIKGHYWLYGKTIKQIDSRLDQLFNESTTVLDASDDRWKREYPEIKASQLPKHHFCSLIKAENSEILEYRKRVLFDLEYKENNQVIPVAQASAIFDYDGLDPEVLLKELKGIKEVTTSEHHKNLIATKPHELPEEKYQKLKSQQSFTQAEQTAIKAKFISNNYGGVEISEELILADSEGLRSKFRLLYALTEGKEICAKLALLSGAKQLKNGAGIVNQHDFNQTFLPTLKAELINKSGALALLAPNTEINQFNPDAVKVLEFLNQNIKSFNDIFGAGFKVTNQEKKFDIRPIRTLLNCLGLTVKESGKPRIPGTNERYRNYIVVYPDIKPSYQEIFKLWLINDTERSEQWDKKLRQYEIEKLVKACHADIDLLDFTEFQQGELFPEAWEFVNTDTRIKIINRVDGFQLPELIKTELNSSDSDFQNHLNDIATWKEISLDIETYGNDTKNKEGLHPRKGFIRFIQVSNGTKTYYANLGGRAENREAIKATLQPFLNLLNEQISNPKVKIIGQNVHFDLRFLRFQLGFNRAQNVADIMLGAKIFFGDYGELKVLPGGYNLENFALKLLGLRINKDEQKSDWGGTITQSQINYVVADPFITYHVWKRLLELYQDPTKFGFGKLAQDGLMEAWQLENDIIPCAIELEHVGLPFDKTLATSMLEQCKVIQAQLLSDWKQLVPGLNYTQNKKLIEHLNTKYELIIKSLNKTALADLAEHSEVQILSKLRAIKIPIQQLESLLRSAEQTGRVKTTFKTLTGTGRFSSGNSKTFNDLPNLQSISAKANPALKDHNLPAVRTCVTPDVSGDFKYWIIDRKIAKKQLANYESMLLGFNPENQEHKAYIEKAVTYLRQLLAVNSSQVSYKDNDFNWIDDKVFVKLFKDRNPQIELIARKITGRGLLIVDLSASHGRIAADVADDETAIAGCNDDSIDNHSKVGVFIAKALGHDVTWEEIAKNKKAMPYKLYRDAAKNTYYGWLNGAGAKRVQEQIKANSGQIVSIEACQAAIKGCETLYPNVVNFRKQMTEELGTKENLLHIDGKFYAVNKIKSVNNRITHLVKITEDDKVDLPYTQCLAAIWSRTEATALKRALIKIIDLAEKKPEWELKAINYVHDEINVEFNTDYTEEVATAVNNIIGDCFTETLSKVSDGRETNWTKLVVNNWSEK